MGDIYRDIAALIFITLCALAAVCVSLTDKRDWRDGE